MLRRSCALFLVVAFAMLALAGPTWALGAELDTGALVITKLFRGIVNAATGWIEIPKQISLTWQAQGPGLGSTWGLVKGVGFAVARSVVGGYEIVTFSLSIPDGYRPIMHPEYVLSDLPEGREPR